MENNEFLWKYVYHCNALDSSSWFTVNITVSPNMVCMVNYATEDLQYRLLIPKYGCTVSHAMEDLQHRILDFSKYYLLRYHVKMEVKSEGKRGKIQMVKGTIQSAKREKWKGNGNLGCQGRENMKCINCTMKVYIKGELWFYNLYKLLFQNLTSMVYIHAYKVFRCIPWIYS